MSTNSVTTSGSEATPSKFNFADLLVTGPQSVAFLSVLLLTASAHKDFPLGGKTTLLRQPDSFKTSAQQVINETYNAYLENDKAFNGLRLLLGQVPQSIDQFFAILNEGGPDELKFLGQNALNSVSKLITKSVTISEQAEKNFNNLIALAQELLVAILSTSGGQALQRAEQRELDLSIVHTGATTKSPVPRIVQFLRKAIDSYQRHTAQVKQITQLLKSAQAVTDTAAPKEIEGLYATLSSGDKTAVQPSQGGAVTLGSLQKDIVAQHAKNVLNIVNAINHISTIYTQVSKEYTLAGQGKLGEMMRFSDKAISPQDDKAFLTQLNEKEAEVLRTNDETTKKILELIAA